MTEYHITKDGAQIGPLTETEVTSGLIDGKFSGNDLVWTPGNADWQLLSTAFPSLHANAVQMPPVPVEKASLPLPGLDLNSWTMKTKDTPFWKFLLGMNVFKSYQLDCVEKRGDVLTVRVLSGKTCTFKIGEFKAKYIKTAQGNRDFILKSTTKPIQKVTFRETELQMPESWWDELEQKIGVTESGVSKLLHKIKSSI